MTTTYSQSLRLWKGQPGDPAIKGAWGLPLDTNQDLIDSAINGTAVINVTGLNSITLSANNGAPDQSRELVQQFTGFIPGDLSVFIPNVPKYGWAQNSTSGSFNVILSAGAGTNAVVPPDGQLYFYACDGATNVILVPLGLASLKVIGALSAGATTVNGVLTVTGRSALQGGITGVNDGSAATAGVVGEYQFIEVLESAPLLIGAGGFSNVAVLTLAAGDWDVWGNAGIVLSAGVTCNNMVVGISTTSAANLGAIAPNKGAFSQMGGVNFFLATLSAGQTRLSLTVPTNVFLIIFAGLTGAVTLHSFGFLGARRVR